MKKLVILLALLLAFVLLANCVSAQTNVVTVYPSQMALVNGSSLSGSVAYLSDIGTNYVEFAEVGGVPGFELDYNFTGISPTALSFNYTVRDYYQEVTPQYHIVYTELYNFSSSAWMIEANYTREPSFTWHTNITSASGLIQNGVVMGRVYHASSGVASHSEWVDYTSLIVTYPTSNGSVGNGWQIGNGWSNPTASPSSSPTPIPTSGVTADEAMGVAVAFGLMAIGLAVVMPIIFMRRRSES